MLIQKTIFLEYLLSRSYFISNKFLSPLDTFDWLNFNFSMSKFSLSWTKCLVPRLIYFSLSQTFGLLPGLLIFHFTCLVGLVWHGARQGKNPNLTKYLKTFATDHVSSRNTVKKSCDSITKRSENIREKKEMCQIAWKRNVGQG